MYEYLVGAVWATMVGVFVAGVVFVLFAIYGIPWLWHLLKPLLHAWTG